MEAVIYSLKADAEEYQNKVAKLFAFPRVGTHQNYSETNGNWVDLSTIPDSGNVQWPNYPGWTIFYASVFKHPSTANWSHAVTQELEDALLDPDFQANVTVGELTYLQTQTALKVTLDSTWFD